MERHDSAKAARRHLEKALNENRKLTVDEQVAIAQAYIELAKVEEYHRRTMLQAEANKITRSQHLKH